MLDGHEGEAAAEHVAQQLPVAVAHQLSRLARCGHCDLRVVWAVQAGMCFLSLFQAGNECSMLCLCRSGNWTDEAVEAALRRAIVETDAAFLRRAEAEGLDDGTTAAFVLRRGQRFLVGSIGDSFAILCGRNGSCVIGEARGGGTPAAGNVAASQPGSSGAPAAADKAAASTADSQQQLRADVLSALHSPGQRDERQRIEDAGGWVKTTAGGQQLQAITLCRIGPMTCVTV